jgi:L-lactate dehydrogenase complex protein LldG
MSKSFILEKVQNQTNPQVSEEKRRAAVKARLERPPVGILPKGPTTRIKKINRFIEKVEASQASILQVTKRGLAKAISEWLRDHNLPAEIRMGSDERLDVIRKEGATSLTIADGPSDGEDLTGVSHGECGFVETGTIAMLSGKDNPTTINFLPENHIIILNQSDILSHYEEIWPRLREKYGAGSMPRALNLITGPSRSADIEQTLLLGAHGPVRLHVLLVRD